MNGLILTELQTLKYVVSSAAEAELGTVHHNGKAAISIRVALDERGHPQGPIPLKTDDNTAEGFFNNIIRKKRSKASYMRFHWMIDRIKQKNGFIRKEAKAIWLIISQSIIHPHITK